MRIDEIIYSLTRQIPELVALVGDRVYPVLKSQRDAFPALVYKVMDTDHDLTMSGPSGLVKDFVIFYAFGTTYTQAALVHQALSDTLHGFKGNVFDLTEPSLSLDFINDEYTIETGTHIQGAWIIDREDMYSDEPKRFGVESNFTIAYCK